MYMYLPNYFQKCIKITEEKGAKGMVINADNFIDYQKLIKSFPTFTTVKQNESRVIFT